MQYQLATQNSLLNQQQGILLLEQGIRGPPLKIQNRPGEGGLKFRTGLF
jgi:hypothetical protein